MEPKPLQTLSSCPLCSATALVPALTVVDHSFSKAPFELMDCAECGFRVTNPRPLPADLPWYYGSPDYISHANTTRTLVERMYMLARAFAVRKKHRLVKSLTNPGLVLDVGCGTGAFLQYLQAHGYQVRGVEPNEGARHEAEAALKIPVPSDISDIPSEEKFDVITMWHVLEHVPDPRSTLAQLNILLKPGGHLILAVPDRNSWDARYYDRFWAAWDVPRHLSHFRSKDMYKLIDAQGFSVVAKRPMWLDSFYISLLSEKYKGAGRIMSLIKGVLLGAFSNLSAIVGSGSTSSTLFISKKPL